MVFQLANGGVFAKHVVTDFGGGHRGTHRGRRACYGIAAKVDRQLHYGFSFRLVLMRMGHCPSGTLSRRTWGGQSCPPGMDQWWVVDGQDCPSYGRLMQLNGVENSAN